MAVVLALASAVVYGASDFLGGLASRRTSVSTASREAKEAAATAGSVCQSITAPTVGVPGAAREDLDRQRPHRNRRDDQLT